MGWPVGPMLKRRMEHAAAVMANRKKTMKVSREDTHDPSVATVSAASHVIENFQKNEGKNG